MATIEKLFVQIFERKRWIIEHLKKQKQLYDQHLASKLLIQGISPPPWLLDPEFSSSASDLSALNKEELISGLLLPRPGPLASYPSGPCFLYDKPVAKAVYNELPHELCATTCASSSGFVEDEPGIVLPHNDHGTEDGPGNFPPCHVNGTQNMPSYVPMSPEDQTETMISSTYSKAEQSLARLHRSRSRQKALELRNSAKASAKSCLGKENDLCIPSIIGTCENCQQLDGLVESLQLDKPSATSAENLTKEEAVIGDCSNKGRTSDACSISPPQSRAIEAIEVQTEDNKEVEKKINNCGGRNTRSRSGFPPSITGDHENHVKSHEVYDGRMTRSRSGKAQNPGTDNPQCGRVVRARSNHTQCINSGRIARSRSCGPKEEEKGDQRSRTKNDMSVKPKQLVFDEVEESSLADVLTKGWDKSEEKTQSHNVNDNSASLPCTISTETTSETYAQSLAYETLEVCDSKVAHSCPKSNRMSGQISLLPDFPSVSLVTKEWPNLTQEANELSLIGADTDATMNLHKEAVEATVCSEKIRHELSSCKDCSMSLHNQTTELVQSSLGRNSAGSSAFTPLFPSANSLDETGYDFALKMFKSDSQYESTGIPTSSSSSSHVGAVGGSKLLELEAGINILPEYNFNNALNGSWPCYKRRKIEYLLHNKSASPSVRVNPFLAVNKSIPRSSSGGEKENTPPISEKLVTSRDSDAVFSDLGFAAIEVDQSLKCSLSKEPKLTLKVHQEGEVAFEGSAMMPDTCKHRKLSTSSVSKVKSADPSNCFSDEEKVGADPSATHCSIRVDEDLECAQDMVDGNSAEKLEPPCFSEEGKVRVDATSATHCRRGGCDELESAGDLCYPDPVINVGHGSAEKSTLDQRHSPQEADKLKFSVGSLLIERMDVCVSDADNAPEFEGFIIADKREIAADAGDGSNDGEIPILFNTSEGISFFEQMGRPASLSTPASPFPTSYKLHLTPGVYRSVPNIDLGSNQLSNSGALQGKSYSDYYSFPSNQHGWDIVKPFVSPLGKGFEGITSKSGDSEKRVSGNPELICFPIQEDPESSEEEGNVNDISNRSIREPLRDITENNETTLDPSHAVETERLESVGEEISVSVIHNKDCKKSEMHQRRQRKQGKENQSLSIGTNNKRKHSESLSSRYSKPKLSRTSSLRSGGQSLSEKEPKRNNIVSSVKSFIPLVQKKQAAAAVPAKREVKVKALEAAEAAKRLAEKRENDRKQKKEALKLERARLEQENLKQMELKKKLKEEERKKRDAENAAKKRQREEEERKEKEKKRKRIEEARSQQQQAEEKIHAWREESRCGTEDGRAHERKDSNNKIENQFYGAKEENISRNPLNKLLGNDRIDAAAVLPTINDNKASTGSSDTVKEGSTDVAEISTPNCDKNDQSVNRTSQEQSYDISPYQCSDDEEEEEDDIPNKKFIPTWASKSCVALALSSLKHLDPDTIFPPGSFCSLEEVLLPRRLQQK